MALRSDEARSRRLCGLRGLNWRGIRSRPSAITGAGNVHDAQPPCLALSRQHLWPRPLRGGAPVEDHGVPGELPTGNLDDVAPVELGQRLQDLFAPVGPPVAGGVLLPRVDLLTQCGVLHEVAAVAGRGLGVPLERVLALGQLPRELDDRLVGLELRERHLEQLTGPLATHLVHEVDRHVVRRRGSSSGAGRCAWRRARRRRSGSRPAATARRAWPSTSRPRGRRGRSAGCTPPA